jgi:hypothetical protein
VDEKGRWMMSNQVVKEPVGCETAEQFLSALSPIGEKFINSRPGDNWLFRGQGQDYPLIPSLLRPAPYNKKIQELTKYDVEDYSQLIKGELDFLIRFFEIADRRGLALPDDSQDFRHTLEKLKIYRKDSKYEINDDTWMTLNETLSVMALAQHYGIPTRLLDWTRLPYVAAFFAAEDAYTHKYNRSSLLVVRAFHYPVFGEQLNYKNALYAIRGVTAPSATNSNLRAQQGVFTLMDFRYTREQTGKCLPLEDSLEIMIEDIKHNQPDSDHWIFNSSLQKFTLPVSEAEKLLFLLAKMDITPSTVYPGYSGIVSDLKMRRSFEKL